MSLRWLCVSASAALCLALGVLSLVYFRQIMRREIEKRLSLQEDGGETFRAWRDVPVPFHLSVYLFHVDNPEEIVLHGDKPRVSERGPYTYREERHKVDVRFYDRPVVSFRERRVYHFCPELSVGSERDSLTTLNVPALAAAMLSERLSPRLRSAVSALLSALGERSALVSLPVGSLLWGYSDPLARALHSLSPALWPSPQFGLLAGFNNSDSGEFVVETGVVDISRVHRVVSWNGMTKLPFWRSARCNDISGTAGEMWPPLVNQSLPLAFFSPDTCRTLDLWFSERRRPGGLPVWRFRVEASLFDNGSSFPANVGFCPCSQSGALNLSSCRSGAPVFVSQPHFFQGDPALVSAVMGLRPDATLHDTFIDVHAETGVPVNVSIRLQINLHVHAVTDIALTGRINPVLFPLMWFSESGHMTESELSHLWWSLVLTPVVVEVVSVLLVLTGATLTLALPLTAAHQRRRRSPAGGGDGKSASETTPLLQG